MKKTRQNNNPARHELRNRFHRRADDDGHEVNAEEKLLEPLAYRSHDKLPLSEGHGADLWLIFR